MNIAWLSSDSVTRGALGVTDRIEGARYLARAGHRVIVVCGASRGAQPFADLDTRLVETRYIPFLTWTALWPGVIRELSRLDPPPDVVITDFALVPAAHRWVRRAGRGGRRPGLILDVRSHPVSTGRTRLLAQRARFALTLRRYGRRVDALTTITPGLRTHVARLARVPVERVPVWSSGCSWCDEPERPGGRPPELDPGVRGRFVVIYQGSLARGRALSEAVEAVDVARRTAPDILLLLLGGGPARSELRERVELLDLADHVWFLDPVSHDRVPDFLHAADVGLAPWPATWDMEVNSPLKLAEYLCFGLPVVLTDITPHRVVPADAPFAFWSRDASPGGMAEALLAARRRRSDLPALGRAAREWARPRLGWSAQFDILGEVVSAVASGGPAATVTSLGPGP
jgi:glycosyltransferase involved in cell wall biosynthesis